MIRLEGKEGIIGGGSLPKCMVLNFINVEAFKLKAEGWSRPPKPMAGRLEFLETKII